MKGGLCTCLDIRVYRFSAALLQEPVKNILINVFGYDPFLLANKSKYPVWLGLLSRMRGRDAW